MDYNKIKELVIQSKNIIENHTINYSFKGDADFVTNIDIAISNHLHERLKELAPNVGFYSEEESGKYTNNCWILDPIDGTTNLVYGYNMSSISLAHCVDGSIVFGIVFNPFNGEVFTAQKNKGAYLNDTVLKTSNRILKDSIIEFGAGSTNKADADNAFNLAKEIFIRCVDIRRICSSALDLCYIAAGRIDGYFEKILKPWDYAAGSLILEEAGGMVTDFTGKKLSFDKSTSIIASNGANYDELYNIISDNQ